MLGPGVNIHRHPLNGRNFEYFSEDPYLAGMMAANAHRGLNHGGVGATIKHFSANSQEISRRWADSIASERAYREIYLKPYEIAVRCGGCYSIMTSYNRINGIHAPINYDLCTQILRNEWGYDGIVMTDWWPNLDDDHKDFEGITLDMASMIRAQNDMYMVVTDTEEAESTIENDLASGKLTRGQLVRTAKNILRMLARVNASVRDDCIGGEYKSIKKERIEIATFDFPKADYDLVVSLPDDGEYIMTVDTETVSFGTAQNNIDCKIGNTEVRFTVGGNAKTDRKTVLLSGGYTKIKLSWRKEQIRVTKLLIEK